VKVLIVGGAGNISTAITRQLLARGDEVLLFKRTASVPEWMKGVRVITGDRTDRAGFRQALAREGPFDAAIDMICYEPADAACDVEVFRGKTKQLIFCSTVDVYSKTSAAYPIKEDSPFGALPSFEYAYRKVLCERLLWEAHGRGDFALTVLRPAATYSESRSPGVHSFGGQTYHLDRLRHGKPFILHGDGMSVWVATHSDDAAVPFTNAVGNPAAYGQAYNVTGDEWMTQNQMWRTIARVLGAPEPDFVYIPADLLGRLAPQEAKWCVENFRYNNIFDNSKVKQELGFRYEIRFEEGSRRSIEHLTSQGRIESWKKYPFYDLIVEAWRRHTEALASEAGEQA
jgi:nucleoside-diphosphate-sugar epimerase